MHFSVYLLFNCAFHQTNKTKRSCVVIQRMKKKKMLEVAVDWILCRFAAFCPSHCATVKSIIGPQPPQPSTSTPWELKNVASAYLAFVPLHNSVSVCASACASSWSISHHRMFRNPGSGLRFFPPLFVHKHNISVAWKSAATSSKFVQKSRPRSLKPRHLIVSWPAMTRMILGASMWLRQCSWFWPSAPSREWVLSFSLRTVK